MKNEVETVTTPESKARLNRLERIIDKRMMALVEVADALRTIHDEKLYLQKCDSFGEYCEKRFKFTKQRGLQLLAFHEDRKLLMENDGGKLFATVTPVSDSQTSPMKGLPSETKKKVWNKAVEASAGKQPKGKTVKHFADAERPLARGGLAAEAIRAKQEEDEALAASVKQEEAESETIEAEQVVTELIVGKFELFAQDYRKYWGRRVSPHSSGAAPSQDSREMNEAIEKLLAKYEK